MLKNQINNWFGEYFVNLSNLMKFEFEISNSKFSFWNSLLINKFA